jgi:hypothetical protein
MTRTRRSRSGRARRARRILVAGAALFFGAQILVGLALDDAPLAVRFAPAEAELARLRSASPPPDVVFFGSSRFMTAIDATEITRTLAEAEGARGPHVERLAVMGSDVVSMAFLFDRMLEAGVRPRIAVLELSPEWLARPPHFLRAHLSRFFRWTDIAHWLPEILIREWDTLSRARLIPVYHYRRELLTWLVGRPPPYLAAPAATPSARGTTPAGAEGVVGADPDAGPAPAAAPLETVETAPGSAPNGLLPGVPDRPAKRWQRRVRPYHMSERAEQTLAGLLARCRDERIRCVLVGPPLASGHRAIYGPDVAPQYGAFLSRLERELGVPFTEYADAADDAEFVDSSHLNDAGRRRFSAEIARSLVAPLWLGLDGHALDPAQPAADGTN